MTSGLPFDDFRALIRNLPGPGEGAAEAVSAVFAKAERRAGGLGVAAETARWLAAWSGRAPAVNRPLVALFAANHGVAAHGVSPRPVSDTAAAVELCAAGGSPVNAVCLAHDLGLKAFDLALDHPTGDITREPALDERGCAATMAFGMEAVAGGSDLVALGDIGVGNSTVAAALLASLFGGQGRDWVGPGSGADAAMIGRKAGAVDVALELHGDHLSDPLEALRRVGGREFSAIAGAILAARTERIPVILDGFAATAAAAVLFKARRDAIDHCLFAHVSPEPGHRRALDAMGRKPLFDLGMAHGEGVGAALAAGFARASALVHAGLAAAAR
ncbi:MAG: nicotinate-nucleotide--dimethylbenzimidazole phosphoribosyltransferase [Rhizobiaceae bacterium]